MTIQRTMPRPTEQPFTEPTATTETIAPSGVSAMVDSVVVRASELLARYSVDLLRISMGVIFLGFGVQKFFPGVSPAEPLVVRTIETLTFGIISGGTALLVTAVLECFIGITLLTGKFLKTGLLVLGGALVGMMSPLVLFFTDMFPGAPTLEAQYILKDIVLAAAGMVIAATALGARLRTDR